MFTFQTRFSNDIEAVQREGCGGCGRGKGWLPGCLAGDKWHQVFPSPYFNPHLPLWVNGGEHKYCQNNIQALRRKWKGGRFVTNVMDEGMAHRVTVVRVFLLEENKLGPIYKGVIITLLFFGHVQIWDMFRASNVIFSFFIFFKPIITSLSLLTIFALAVWNDET